MVVFLECLGPFLPFWVYSIDDIHAFWSTLLPMCMLVAPKRACFAQMQLWWPQNRPKSDLLHTVKMLLLLLNMYGMGWGRSYYLRRYGAASAALKPAWFEELLYSSNRASIDMLIWSFMI